MMTSTLPLTGYYVGCPGCGFTYVHLHDAHRFVEGPWTRSIVDFRPVDASGEEDEDAPLERVSVAHVATVEALKDLSCPICRRSIRLRIVSCGCEGEAETSITAL